MVSYAPNYDVRDPVNAKIESPRTRRGCGKQRGSPYHRYSFEEPESPLMNFGRKIRREPIYAPPVQGKGDVITHIYCQGCNTKYATRKTRRYSCS